MSILVAGLMIAGLFGVLAFPALHYAKRAGVLSFSELALPIAPAICFLIGLQALNAPAQVGYAFVIGPILCSVISLILLYVRVFAFGSLKAQPRLAGFILVAACLAALILGVTVPPWYD